MKLPWKTLYIGKVVEVVKIEEIERYVGKVYAFAVKQTFSEDEAADLSQEILFTAIRSLPTLRDDCKFEFWLWGIAKNVSKSFRRRQGRQRAMFFYNVPEELAAESNDDETEELYNLLRQKISMLSAMYRDIIILYYYDNLSTKDIAARLGIPEGTVTWRLSEARKKLKKECTEMEETALRPTKLTFGFYGDYDPNYVKIPAPHVFISDALSQNILYYCYEEPQSVEELSKLCGVPAYYVEERIQHLLKYDALTEAAKGKYRTDFIIWSDKHGIYCEENAEKILMPIMDKLLTALKNIAAQADQIPFYKAGKEPKDLFYLYGALAFQYVQAHYCDLPNPHIGEKYNGMCWSYSGNLETGAHERICINVHHSANLVSRGHYSHTVFSGFGGLTHRDMMCDLYINACEDILLTDTSKDANATALAIQSGYITRREDNRLSVTVPAFTKEQKKEFDGIVEKYLAPLMEEYSSIVRQFIAGYKKLFPKHLQEEADRMCYHMFLSLYHTVIAYAQRTGSIEPPSPNCPCDVLIQHK